MASQDGSVQATTDDATVSKFSSASFGYFSDPLLKYFVRHPVKRSPLINRGYYARVSALRKIVDRFFGLFPRGQIVNLGAGLDSLTLRTAERFPESVCFEIDFPEVIARKSSIVARTPELRRIAKGVADPEDDDGNIDTGGGCRVTARRVSLIPGDLREMKNVYPELITAGFQRDKPTLFLAECVLVYMKPAESDQIIQWAASACEAPSCFVVYEQISPNDAFGQMMVRNLESRGCPLVGIHKYPSLSSQSARYSKLGWTSSSTLDMNGVYDSYIDAEDVARAEKCELFDEIEEWRLISAHYFILVATIRSQWDTSISSAPRSPDNRVISDPSDDDGNQFPSAYFLSRDDAGRALKPKPSGT